MILKEYLHSILPSNFIACLTIFLSCVVIIKLVVFIVIMIVHRKQYRMLSSEINRIKGNKFRPSKIEKLGRFFTQLYYPSKQSIEFIFLVVMVIFLVIPYLFLLRQNLFPELIPSFDKSLYQNLIAIQAGIAAFIFPIIILIIGLSGDRSEVCLKRLDVLLRESYLFPLSIFVIMGLLHFIWCRITWFSISVISLSAIGGIYALSAIIQILRNNNIFLKKAELLFKEKIRRSISKAIEERLGRNRLVNWIKERDLPIEYFPIEISEDDNYQFITDNRRGVIFDINLEKLEEFAKTLEKMANKKKYSYKEKQEISTEDYYSQEGTKEFEEEKFLQDKRRYMLKTFRDTLSEKNNKCFCFLKKIVDENELEKLKKLAKKAFIIKPDDNFSETMRAELYNLKDSIIYAINNQSLGWLEKLLNIYKELGIEFLRETNKYDIKYSFAMASKELKSLKGGWNEISWISSDLLDIFEIGEKSHNKEILRYVAYTPISIATNAIFYRNHYVFKEFIRFAHYLYESSIDDKSPKLKRFKIDRSWRYLKEMVNLHILYQLKECHERNKLNDMKDFVVAIIIIFQNLLKRSIELNDSEAFNKFKNAILGLLKNFLPRAKNLIEISNEINLRRNQALFGLAALVLSKHIGNTKKNNWIKFYSELRFVFDVGLYEFTEIFLEILAFDAEEFFGWDIWELEGVPEMVVIRSDFKSDLIRFFCVNILYLLRNKSPSNLECAELPFSHELTMLVEIKDSSLIRILNDIESNPEKYGSILDEDAISKIPLLRKILKNAAENQKEKEINEMMKRQISPVMVDEFRQKIVSSFYEIADFRKIAKNFGIFMDFKDQLNPNIGSYGYKMIDDKGPFIDDWHIGYYGWGEVYGRGLAQSEDNFIFNRMIDSIHTCLRATTSEELLVAINEATKELQEKGYSPNIILTSLDARSIHTFYGMDNFMHTWNRNFPQFGIEICDGAIKIENAYFPVFRIYTPEPKNIAIVIDLKKFGKLTQYAAYNDEEEKKYKHNIFYIRVYDLFFNERIRKQILDEKPQWLQKYSDQEKYLQQKVLIIAREKFEFKIDDPKSASRIEIMYRGESNAKTKKLPNK